MTQRDETSHIIIEQDRGSSVVPFLLGALLGAGVALLFAPRSGEETQAELRARASKLRDAAEVKLRKVQADLEDRVGAVREAVDAGRTTARDTAREVRDELSERLERTRAAARAGATAVRDAALGEDDHDEAVS